MRRGSMRPSQEVRRGLSTLEPGRSVTHYVIHKHAAWLGIFALLAAGVLCGFALGLLVGVSA